MKIVINVCFGGFALSDMAYELLNSKFGMPIVKYEEKKYKDEKVIFDRNLTKEHSIFPERYWSSWTYGDEIRSDDSIVAVVEELGEAANGQYAKLKVVEIPDGISWEIDEYDGRESVSETHRSWH